MRRHGVGGLVLLLTAAAHATAGGPAGELQDRARQVRAAAERVAAATVVFGYGNGSGVVVSRDGYVLTAAHNFDLYPDDPNFRLVLADGREVAARRLGCNRALDAGLMKITDPGVWPFAELADPAALPHRGDWCVCLGHPGGYDPRRPRPPVRAGRVQHASDRRLLTDCATARGDSGGPLADLAGRVVGVHSGIHAYVPYSRHVPVAAFLADWDRLARGERWGQSYASPPAWRTYFGATVDYAARDRASVTAVDPGSPAAAAGLEAGDVVAALDGEAVTHPDLLADLLDDRKPGDMARLTLRRGDRETAVVTTLRPRGPTAPVPKPVRRPPWTEADTRARKAGPHERAASDILGAFKPVTAQVASAVVAVKVGGAVVALGAVVDAEGGVLTKATDLNGAAAPSVVFADGTERPARVSAVDDEYDLALLATRGPATAPVRWADRPPEPGSLVVTPGPGGRPLAAGVVCGGARSLAAAPQLSLGARFPHPRGLLIDGTPLPPAAERAGLRGGDVLVAVGGKPVTTSVSVADAVGGMEPGGTAAVEVLRGAERLSARVTLGSAAGYPDWLRAEMVGGGAVPSRRPTGYPAAFPHDSPLLPEQCGGPLVGLDGRAVGLNVCRFGRVESFAVPPERVRERLARLRASK